MKPSIKDLKTKEELLQRYFDINQQHFLIGQGEVLKDLDYSLKVKVSNDLYLTLRELEAKINSL